MSGGARYWNEETQRWEDGAGPQAGTPVTPPPPAMPDRAPEWPPAGPPTAGEGAPAPESAPPVPPTPDSAPPAPPVPWPDSAGGWHGPRTGAADSTTGGPGGTAGAGWSAPEWPVQPEPVPVPAGGLSRRTVWTVVVGAAVVGVAVSLVLTLVIKPGHHDRPSSASGSPSPSVVSASPAPTGDTSGSPSPTDGTASPSASASPLPSGWESYDDEEGFRIARPTGWSRSSVPSSYGIKVVNYRSPDKEHRLQIYQVAEPSPQASFELYLSDHTRKPAGFQKLSLVNLDQGDFVGSRLEYLADTIKGEPDVGTWHVYDERFTAADGRIYAVAAYGPDRDGADADLRLLETALSGFCPPDTGCDAPMD